MAVTKSSVTPKTTSGQSRFARGAENVMSDFAVPREYQ